MRILLDNFSYYFSLTGSSGGLFSMECRFRPLLAGKEDAGAGKAATRRIMRTYTDVLDRLYGDVIKGDREPILADSPYVVSTGYRYSGYLTRRGLRVIDERLREAFGEEAADPRGEVSVHQHLRATVECSFGKKGQDLEDVSVVVKPEMNHLLNVCFFRFTRRQEGIEVGSAPRTNMDGLERMLKATAEREGLDYFEMLTKR